MKYAVIAEVASEYPVSQMCQMLKVSESGYYGWLKRSPSRRHQEQTSLKSQIQAIWGNIDGSMVRRLYTMRCGIEGFVSGDIGSYVSCGRWPLQARAIANVVRARHRSMPPSRSLPTCWIDSSMMSLAARSGSVTLPNIDTDEGDLYLAGLMDLGSREIVGMALADHMRTELVDNALQMAVRQHRPQPGTLHHSDRGSQYTSVGYQQALATAGMRVSMSRTGSCLDNAPMESFWATLKRECADQPFRSHDHARIAIFDYVMGFYNRERKHSALGYLSPTQYARQQL